MASFETPGDITLKPGQKEGWEFLLPIAESATAKGAIPFGRTISSVDVDVYDADGTNVTDIIIDGTPSFADNIVYITFQYPDIWGDGRYRTRILVTMDNGWTKPFIFDRVYCRTSQL